MVKYLTVNVLTEGIPMNVLFLVGSLRAGSFNRLLADAAAALLREGAEATVADLASLPHYSEDLEGEVPAAVTAFRAQVEAADALVVVTPEYNGSLSGVVKNALDWASRPRGAASIAGKPAAVLAASGSPRGAQWAREDAVKVLKVAGAAPLEDTVGVGDSYAAFDDGRLSDAEVEAAVRDLLSALRAGRAAA